MKRVSRVLVVFSLAAFLLFTTVSMAPAAAAGPFYVGIFGGYVIPGDMNFEEEDSDLDVDVELDDSWAVGAKIGYIFPYAKWCAIEFEYTYLADQDGDESWTYRDWTDKLSGEFSAHNLMINMLFRYPEGKIHPYVGGGMGMSMANFEIKAEELDGDTVVHSVSADKDDTAFAMQFIAGVNFEITPNISIDLAYKYIYCEYDISYLDIESKNNLFTGGINFHF